MKTLSIMDFNPEAVVVDAGQFPSNPRALHWLDVCDRIVCCDGAANHFVASGRTPWRIVGDGDSLAPQLRQQYAGILRHNPDQETNDQTKAVDYLAARGVRCLAILGATGLREDHTLGNISLLIDYMERGIEVRAYTDYGVFIPVSGSCRFSVCPGTQVSIFNFGATNLSADGLRYPLRDFNRWWQGTLNEAAASTFIISGRGSYLVFLNYPALMMRGSFLK